MRRTPNVYTITPEIAFLPRLVEALFANALDLGVDYTTDPLKLADLTIYVPTRRAAKALSACFAGKMDKRATFLPRILPLGGFGGDEEPLFETEFTAQQAIPALERRLLLSHWILAWGLHLREAVVSIGADGSQRSIEPSETFNSVANPADAYALSGDLAALIDECVIEGIAFDKFETLGQGTYDDYWRITLGFLKIAFENWPRHLLENSMTEAATQRAMLIDHEVERIARGTMRGPMIVAGSTGTNDATARLIRAIARSQHGAVVLPGLDLSLDEPGFISIGDDALATHPQAALVRLLGKIGMARSDVRELGKPGLRSRFLSEALRPALSTEKWHEQPPWRVADLVADFANITLIEAENEREEALSIAIVVREALEHPTRTVALITPERTLAQRVSSELARWGIVPEDSAGSSLPRTPAGAFALHLLNAARGSDPVKGLDAASLLTLLKHPLFRLGRDAPQVKLLAHRVEACVFRQLDIDLAGSLQAAVLEAETLAKSRHAPGFLQALAPGDWTGIAALLQDLDAALAPLRNCAPASLALWAAQHLAALERVCAEELHGRDGAAVVSLLRELETTATAALVLSLDDYIHLLSQMMAEKTVRRYSTGHPRLAVLGLLEARLMTADVVILAGLDEKIWPPQAKSDALMNRTMRAELGLSSPERRLGQTAHDFMMGFCSENLVMTRAKKRGGEPTVASRFLQRIEAVAGEHIAPCRALGLAKLDWARRIDDGRAEPLKRPAPLPPVELRPKALSVTAIETLRRDPYSIFAARILKLPVLGPLQPDFSARDLGTKMHAIFERFVKAAPREALPPAPEQFLLALAADIFSGVWETPAFATFGRAKVERMLDQFLTFERARRDNIVEIHTEAHGKLSLFLADGSAFVLSAIADRADYNKDGSLSLIDYKTGALPGPGQVLAGFAPQLTLEAEMARRDAFKLPKASRIEAVYVKFGGRKGVEERTPQGKNGGDLAELGLKHFDELHSLLSQFRNLATAYHPRPFPQYVRENLDYDHLSRFKEWSSLGLDDEGGE